MTLHDVADVCPVDIVVKPPPHVLQISLYPPGINPPGEYWPLLQIVHDDFDPDVAKLPYPGLHMQYGNVILAVAESHVVHVPALPRVIAVPGVKFNGYCPAVAHEVFWKPVSFMVEHVCVTY